MQDMVTKLTADFLKTLAHPARIKILKLLQPGECCVCELIPAIDIEQSNLSQHLSMLKKQGIIQSRKEGTKVFYCLAYPAVMDLLEIVEKILVEQISHSHSLLKHLR